MSWPDCALVRDFAQQQHLASTGLPGGRELETVVDRLLRAARK
jgi:hypothetical protein